MNEEFDSRFFEIMTDEKGQKRPVLRERLHHFVDPNASFKTFDSKYGHCALCGCLSCNGYCFK